MTAGLPRAIEVKLPWGATVEVGVVVSPVIPTRKQGVAAQASLRVDFDTRQLQLAILSHTLELGGEALAALLPGLEKLATMPDWDRLKVATAIAQELEKHSVALVPL